MFLLVLFFAPKKRTLHFGSFQKEQTIASLKKPNTPHADDNTSS